MSIDYAKVGLKVGLEIHQQLNVNSKLFCSCPPELFKEEPRNHFSTQTYAQPRVNWGRLTPQRILNSRKA